MYVCMYIRPPTFSSYLLYMIVKKENNEGNKAGPISKWRSSKGEIVGEREKLLVNSWRNSDHKVNEDHYEEIMDLTQMDYSPARRKSPIHN